MNKQLRCEHICAAAFLAFSGQLRTTGAEDFHKRERGGEGEREGGGERGREGNGGGGRERETETIMSAEECQQKIMHQIQLSGNWF